jgi:CHAD domain-containing protein
MTYRLKEKEDVSVGLRRILLEELVEARSRMGDDLNRDPSEAIHDARKRFKKCRAVLRLVRSDIGRKEYKALNRSLRDSGRILSPVRDADVLVATVESLIEDKRRLVATRTILGERRDTVRDQILGDDKSVGEVRAHLDELELRISRLTFSSDGSALLVEGLKDCYAEGRRAYSECLDKPTNESLHEWRKRSKDVWYHVRILKSLWPEMIDALVDESHRLSDLLGSDHDLAVLTDTLLTDRDGFKADQISEIMSLIDERRPRLQADAFMIGARLFAEKPGRYARRFDAYWNAHMADPSTIVSSMPATAAANRR